MRRQVEKDRRVGPGQAEHAELEVFDPVHERRALVGRQLGGLVRNVGSDVAIVDDHVATLVEPLQFVAVFEPVAGIQNGDELGMNGVERPERAVEVVADLAPEQGLLIRRKRDDGGGQVVRLAPLAQQFGLRAFAASVDAFEGDAYSHK